MLNFLKEKGLKLYMNNNPIVSRIAEILEVKMEKGKIDLAAKLKGETEPISLAVNYAINGNELRVANVKSNKEWVNGLAEAFKERYSKIDLSRYGWAVGVVRHLF
jgi:hypothetical protein